MKTFGLIAAAALALPTVAIAQEAPMQSTMPAPSGTATDSTLSTQDPTTGTSTRTPAPSSTQPGTDLNTPGTDSTMSPTSPSTTSPTVPPQA